MAFSDNNLTLKKLNIKGNKEAASLVRNLYIEAFPKAERIPWRIMSMMLKRKGIECIAYYDSERFCGFTYSIVTEKLYFIYYLAISGTHRGEGYGSRILSLIKEMYPTRAVVLNMEPVDEEADNIAQRRRRYEFYTRNGFYDTGFDVYEIGGRFTVMSTIKELDVTDYKEIFRYLSFGIWNVRVDKRPKYKQ